jgi:hypothetical protein
MSQRARFLLILIVVTSVATSSWAERPPEPKPQADLIVTGEVGKVYVNTDSANINYIVEIEVRAVEKGQGIEPGQALDARCFQRRRDAPRVPAAYGHHQVPREGDLVRAYLMRRPNGRYEGTYPNWIDPIGSGPPGGGAPGPRAPSPRWALGVYTQPVRLGDRLGLQITQVAPGGAAQRVGLEAGDIIVEANGEMTRSQQDLLRAIAQSGVSLKVTIRDVRTGAMSTVEVALQPLATARP